MPTFLEALTAEIAGLEKKLSNDPTFVKLQAAKALLMAYKQSESGVVSPTPATQRANPVSRPFASGMSAKIVDAVREFLGDKTTPVPTRDLMEMLAERQISVSGSNPQNTVSSILSKSDDILSNGRAGWTLKRNEPPMGGSETGEVDASSDHTNQKDHEDLIGYYS